MNNIVTVVSKYIPATSSLLYRFTNGAIWSLIGAISSRGLLTICMIIVARHLGVEGFGKFDAIQSTVAVFQLFAGFSLGLMSTRYIAEYKKNDIVKTSRILTLSTIVAIITGLTCAIIIFSLAPWLAKTALSDPQLATSLRISSVTIFFSAINGAQVGALSGFEAFKKTAWVNTITAVLAFLITLAGMYLYGLIGVVSGLAISQSITWLFYHNTLRGEIAKVGISFTVNGIRTELPILLKFTLPAVLSDLLVTPAIWFCRSLLVTKSEGFSELGIFAVGLQIAMIVTYISGVLGTPLLPILSGQHSEHHSTKVYYFNIFFYWLLSIIMCVPLLAFPEFVTWIFGAQFSTDRTKQVIVLVLFYTLINTFKRGLANAVVVNGQMWWAFASNSLWGVLLISFFFYFVSWGALGLAISMTISYVLNAIIFLPVYLQTGIVPKSTLFSIEALVIWTSIIGITIGSLLLLPILFRLFLFLCGCTVIGFATKRMIVKAMVGTRF